LNPKIRGLNLPIREKPKVPEGAEEGRRSPMEERVAEQEVIPA